MLQLLPFKFVRDVGTFFLQKISMGHLQVVVSDYLIEKNIHVQVMVHGLHVLAETVKYVQTLCNMYVLISNYIISCNTVGN